MNLRPLTGADAPRLREIRAMPEVARWWHPPEDDFPLSDDPGAVRFVIEHEVEVIGLVQYEEEDDPNYRNAWIDIFIAATHHGSGLGTEAIEAVCRHLFDERGHHRLVIDPAAENAAAIRCYEKAGFRRVGVMRQYERSPEGVWRDGLLMELVRDR